MRYTFKNNGLASFNFDTFLANETEGRTAQQRIQGTVQKTVRRRSGRNGRIRMALATAGLYQEAYLELRDESAEFGYGKLNLTAYAIR